MEAIETELNAWHQELYPLRVDLVGDYAGQELFFVEGDSLLRFAFSDEKIDMDGGFQLLHAVYAVECFLTNLKKRKCTFHLVFFEENKFLCIPSRASAGSRYKYLFSRSAIIQHLLSTSKSLNAGDPFRIYQFQSPDDANFQQYLAATRPYFTMCHDGTDDLKKNRSLRFLTKAFIWRMVLAGYSAAFINDVEFRDSKIMTQVVQGGLRTSFTDKHLQQCSQIIYKILLRGNSPDLKYDYDFPTIPADSVVSERELMTVASVSAILQRPGLSAMETFHTAIFVLHIAYLNHLSLPQRSLEYTQPRSKIWRKFDKTIEWIILVSRYFLEDKSYQYTATQLKSNIYDYIDGRLLKKLQIQIESGHFQIDSLPKFVLCDFTRMAKAIETVSGHTISLQHQTNRNIDSSSNKLGSLQRPVDTDLELAVLPFSNPTFDVFLSQIKLTIDTSAAAIEFDKRNTRLQQPAQLQSQIPLEKKTTEMILRPWKKSGNEWLTKKRLKKEQLDFARMTKYAASLVGAQGKMLEPVLITKSPMQLTNKKASSVGPTNQPAKREKAKSKAPSKKDQIRAENNKKLSEKEDLALQRMWKTLYSDIHVATCEEAKVSRLDRFLVDIGPTSSERSSVIQVEVRLYKIWTLQRIWAGFCRENARDDGYQVVAVLFDEARKVLASRGLTNRVHVILKNLFEALGIQLPPLGSPDSLLDTKLTFNTTWDGTSVVDIRLRMTSTEFQLKYCGQYMDRDMDSKPDPRVSFAPDGWQRKVLDEIDQNNSVFVVAPTSAGKTFISFYAMEKILRFDDEGVLVYIVPTKALVNQIAAEVMARFRKTYAHSGKSVWAIYTRDHRINNSTGCQILITVPHILQIMLLSPQNANSWSMRVKRIIFDEIHCIGQAEDGVVWEQLLLLSPCPIIALSATVGNPDEFNSWMRSTQNSLGIKLTMVQHHHRYSDLRKIFYSYPESYVFTGLKTGSMFARLDGTPCFAHLHPIASLIDSSRDMPEDLALEPGDCLSLYRAMKKNSTEKFEVKSNLDPEIFFKKSPVIRKADMIKWEAKLKVGFQHWMKSSESPFNHIIRELGGANKFVYEVARQENRNTKGLNTEQGADADHQNERALKEATEVSSGLPTLLKTTLPLLDELNSRNALPAIIFCFDRAICNRLCLRILKQLEEAENKWQKVSPEWANTLRKWTEHNAAKKSRSAKKQAKSTARNTEDSKEEKMRESASISEGSSFYDSFNPKDPLAQFSFADKTKYSNEELKEELDSMGLVGTVPSYLLDALGRGVGVHHSGLNRRYLHTVEMLFRNGYLRVIFATGTLALGINMPCKTVVFGGDSVWLTALNFRQAAGRAGRRGFDDFGNVVFLGISMTKVRLLISSKLPSLVGHFPITTSLVLRLFNLLHDSNGSEHAKRAINGLLSQPRLYLGDSSFKEQVLHHLRFSIEYLRRQNLLGPGGETLNFSRIAGHLYYTENSSFAFHALLRGGFFHSVCADINAKPHQTCMTIMLVMAHLFGRLQCRKGDPVNKLPPLPRRATAILENHNQKTLQIYTTYVKTFAAEHCSSIMDNILPFSHLACETTEMPIEQIPISPLPPVLARSSFVALSGLGDTFTSISDLTDSVRTGIFLEKSVVPHLATGDKIELNSYLLDFYRHGEIPTLIKKNQIRSSDVWFALNEFSLVLATVVTSLTKVVACESDDDLFDFSGLGDTDELEMDDHASEVDEIEYESDWGGSSESEDDDGSDSVMNGAGLVNVLMGFEMLKTTFNRKFKAMWA